MFGARNTGGVFNEIMTAVDSVHLRLLQRQHLVNPSPTCMILDSMAAMQTGPGQGASLTDARELPKGRHYSGWAPGTNYSVAKGPVRHYVNWSHYSVPIAIAGPELHDATGMTSDQLIGTQRVMGEMDGKKRYMYYNLLGKRIQDSGDDLKLTAAADLWGTPLSSDPQGEYEGDRPVSFDDLFDENEGLHGLAYDGLGEWDTEKHPWGFNGAPGSIANRRQFVHMPRIFENSGTLRALTKAIVQPVLHSMASIGGQYICGLHPDLTDTLFSEFDDNDQGPVLLGYDQWRSQINSTHYQNCVFFHDYHAPKDRIRLIHVGDNMGGERSDAGFQIVNWVPPEMYDGLSRVMQMNMNNLQKEPRGLRFGYNADKPYYRDEFMRLPGFEDATGFKIRRRWMQVCYQRWKHIEIRDLRG